MKPMKEAAPVTSRQMSPHLFEVHWLSDCYLNTVPTVKVLAMKAQTVQHPGTINLGYILAFVL